jgi:hypothetical protein
MIGKPAINQFTKNREQDANEKNSNPVIYQFCHRFYPLKSLESVWLAGSPRLWMPGIP